MKLRILLFLTVAISLIHTAANAQSVSAWQDATSKWERAAMLWEAKALECEGITHPEIGDVLEWRKFNRENTWANMVRRRDEALHVLHIQEPSRMTGRVVAFTLPPTQTQWLCGCGGVPGTKEFNDCCEAATKATTAKTGNDIECTRENLLLAIQKAARQIPDYVDLGGLTGVITFSGSGTTWTYPPPDKYAGKTHLERLKAIAEDKEKEAQEARRAADAEETRKADILFVKRIAKECGKSSP